MKAKTKILALVEIAIVVCSVFLVTIPAIATEQKQEMQKVSISEITTAPENDFVLGVFGNANEDDTIDMRDMTYIKLIFFGKKPETKFADAKYDGKINPLDFIQIKLIIVGKEKELTIVDDVGRVITIDVPVKRIVSIAGSYGPEAFCALGVQDRLVGVADYAKEHAPHLKSFLEDISGVGSSKEPDVEKILGLKPQIVQSYVCYYKYHSKLEEALNAAGIKLVVIDFHKPKTYTNAMRIMGYILDKRERAEKLIEFEKEHINLIKERVKDLTDERKVRVYFNSYPYYWGVTKTGGRSNPMHDRIEICGGINIFADIEAHSPVVDPEEVIVRNPQVIIATTHAGATTGALGYGITDTISVEELRNTIMNYPGWDQIDAVKNGRVYIISTAASSTHDCVFLSYMAKCFYPELFKDIDPDAIYAGWFQKFLSIEFKGVYAYPPPETW